MSTTPGLMMHVCPECGETTACGLHAAAPEMYEALRSVLAKRGGTMALTATDERAVAIRALLARLDAQEIRS